MERCKRCLAITAVWSVVLVFSTLGCMALPQEAPEGVPLSSTSAASADEKDSVPVLCPPVINSFAASPATISLGQLATLSWDVSDATTVTIHPAIRSGGLSSVGHSMEQVSPNTTTTYTLTAANDAGSSTASATITVVAVEETLVGCDPVSGRNQEIDFRWEQLCLSSEYQVQIAKDPDFTLIVVDTGPFATASPTSPAAYYPAGGRLEAGHTYYWRARVRQTATGQILHSPWSDVRSFTVGSGLPANTDSYGLQLPYPSNSFAGCPVKPVSFSWSPLKGTTKYSFVLAKDAALTDIVVEAEVAPTAYEYDGTLEYSTSYFWRVRALEPVPSDWSATFSFQTEPIPAALPSEVISPEELPAAPLWAWVVIAIGIVLLIVIVLLIFRVRWR